MDSESSSQPLSLQSWRLSDADSSKREKSGQAAKLSLPLVSAKQIIRALKRSFENWKIYFSQRSKSQAQRQVGKRASTLSSESRGRPVRYKIPLDFPKDNLAFLPSVVEAVVRQGPQLPVKFVRDDLRVWVRQGKSPLTIVLIADSSASIFHFLEPTAKVISSLYRDAYRNRDKLGLVAIQDGKARIINHPSRNLQVVLGNLTRLRPSGVTPLSKALELAFDVFKQERRRQPFFNPLAILLSDCHPEPVTSPGGNLMEESPYKEAMKTAQLFQRARIPIVVINPGHGTFKNGQQWWGTQLAIRIAALSRGKYYGILHNRYQKGGGLIRQRLEKRNLNIDSKAVEQILLNFRDRPTDFSRGGLI